jgi:hypothetical protein
LPKKKSDTVATDGCTVSSSNASNSKVDRWKSRCLTIGYDGKGSGNIGKYKVLFFFYPPKKI